MRTYWHVTYNTRFTGNRYYIKDNANYWINRAMSNANNKVGLYCFEVFCVSRIIPSWCFNEFDNWIRYYSGMYPDASCKPYPRYKV